MLPGFLSQMLLLMNSGLVLQDAFCRVAEGYEGLPEQRRNYFTEAICEMHRRSLQNGENVIRQFQQFGRGCGVKEVARVSSIMAENLNRGTDLWQQLAEESSQLWQERRRMAMEQIRLSESKMSFPLGILMISLLLVTAAPALMQLS